MLNEKDNTQTGLPHHNGRQHLNLFFLSQHSMDCLIFYVLSSFSNQRGEMRKCYCLIISASFINAFAFLGEGSARVWWHVLA